MNQKINRYEALLYSDEFINKKFPFIIMITNTKYSMNSDVITVFQATSIQKFINEAYGKVKPKEIKSIIVFTNF